MNQYMKNRLETIITFHFAKHIRRDQISRLKFTNSFRKPVLSVKLSFRNGHEKIPPLTRDIMYATLI